MKASDEITVTVVGRRCVYLNDFRIAGGKPYVSENLTQHDLKATVGDILQALGLPVSVLSARQKRQNDE